MTFAIPGDVKSLCDLFDIPAAATPRISPPTPPALALEVAEELYKAVVEFDENDVALEPSSSEKSLNALLEDSGYSVVTPSSETELPELASDFHEPSPQSPSSHKVSSSDEPSSQNPTIDQRLLHTPVPETVHAASPDQRPETTELLDINTISFPIIGHTILYSTEYLANLEPQHRITLSGHAHKRYKQLREEESTSARSELMQLHAQIVRLLDLNIVADRIEMERRKNAPFPPSSNSHEDVHNSDTTTDADERPDPTLPQHRPATTTPTTISAPSSSSSSTARATTRSRPLPFPPPLPPPPALPHTRPHPTATPPAISPPPRSRLQHLALLDEVEREDQERGGKGRLSFEEFEEIMKGERGRKLGFVGAWIEMASF